MSWTKSEKHALVIVASLIIVFLFAAQFVSTFAYSPDGARSSSLEQYASPSIAPPNRTQLIDESPSAAYDSLDPGVGFFVTDGYFQNVFQGLVLYNGSNSKQVVPSLASSWSISGNYEKYTFTMRSKTWFSNKDPINAYVAWFSFVRVLYMNDPDGIGISNYASITVNLTNPLDVTPQGNIFPDGLQNALANAGLCTVSKTNDGSCVAALNYMLSNFNANNATQVKVMSYPKQAYVALSSSKFQVNTIQPYKLLLLVLPPQWGAMVDPVYIDANGGVQNNTQPETFSANGMPGSGPYEYGTHAVGNTELTLNENPNYWAKGVSGLASVLEPAHIKTIIMEFGNLPSTYISDFASNKAQIIAPSIDVFSEAWSAYHSAYPRVSFNSIFELKGYPLCDIANGINTQYAGPSTGFGYSPVNFTNVRQALVHAVNYSEISQELYSTTNPSNGSLLTLGQLFLPPVPPGFGKLDNPAKIPLYSYNITLAQQLIATAGKADHFYVTLPNGTKLGDTSGSDFSDLDYVYILPWDQFQATLFGIMTQGLNQTGITLDPIGITESQFEADEVSPATAPPLVAGGVGWCADWADPIYQQFYDLATPIAHEANWVNNATLTTLLTEIPFELNSTLQLEQTKEAYNIFTQISSILQMPNQATYFWAQPYVKNLVYSSFQYGIFYNEITYS